MSEQNEIIQTVKKIKGHAVTSVTGNADLRIYNYYYGYRKEVRVLPVKPGETVTEEQLPSPYRGLFHFGPEDEQFFFGRELFVTELVQATQTHNFIPVLGASGSGKSSVVFAGLIPKLQREGHWQFTHFRPGTIRTKEGHSTVDPFYALATALIPLYEPNLNTTDQFAQASKLAEYLYRGEVLLGDVVTKFQHNYPQHRLLVIADQFEELYTLCQDEALRRRFLDILLDSIHCPLSPAKSPLVLLTTMRVDFLGNALSYHRFADVLRRIPDIKIRSMNPNELSHVIEKPAQKLKVMFETGLVKRILEEVKDEPGNLPLLEFALTSLWLKRQGNQLTHKAYEEIGEVKGALTKYAEQKYSELNPNQQEQVRRIFVQLVRPGEGTEDTRRLATKDELGESKWSLVKQLADERLVVTSRNTAEQETVEVVHEALIRNWSQLQQWMKKDRLFRAWQERLRTIIHQWEETNRDEGVLLRGVPLGEAEEKLKERREDLSPSEQNFIQQSIELHERLFQEEEKRRQDELETARKIAQESEARRKAAQRTTRVTFGASVIILGFTIFAGYQWKQAETQQIQALLQSSEANLNSSQELGLDARVASLAAGKILKHSWWQAILPDIGLKNQVLGELSQTIYNAGRELNRFEGNQGWVKSVVFSPDSKLFATCGTDNTVRLWDISGKQLAVINAVNSVVFSSDGKLLATTGFDGTGRLWNTSGKQLAVINGVNSVALSLDGKLLATSGNNGTTSLWDTSGKQLAVLKNDQDLFTSVVFSPDSKLLAISGSYRNTPLWNTTSLWDTSGKQLAVLNGGNNVVFSSDGKLLATSGNNGTTSLWDTSGKQLAILNGTGGGFPKSVVFSPNGKLLATCGNGTAVLWNTSGQLLTVLNGAGGRVNSVVFSPDGKLLATGGDDRTARLWDTSNILGEQLAVFKGSLGAVTSVAFSPDGKLFATSGGDRTARLWNISGKKLPVLKGKPGDFASVVFSPDGKLLATLDFYGTAHLWDILGKQSAVLKGHQGEIRSVVFSPDGKLLATGGDDRTARLWDTSGKQSAVLKGHQGRVYDVVFSPDGKLLATGGDDRTARLWDTSGKQLAVFKGHQGRVYDVVFSPDGKLLATSGDDGTARLWNISGKQLAVFARFPFGGGSIVFSPDSKLFVATGGQDGTARLWDISGKQLAVLKDDQGAVNSAAFSPDGKLLATGGQDGTARLWDTSGKQLAVLKSDQGWVKRVAFSPDGKLLATGGQDGTVRLWDTSGKQLVVLKYHQGSVNGQASVNSLVFSPDGKLLATPGEYGTVLWQVGGLDELLAVSCDWVSGYVQTNPNVRDHTLCNDVATQK